MNTKMISCCALALALAGTSLSSASVKAPAPTRATPDITHLFTRALEIVRSKPHFPRAVVLEADGLPAGKRPVNRAAEITRWHFEFSNDKVPFGGVTINYSRSKGFAAPVGHKFHLLEDYEIKTPPKLTLTRAVSLLNKAGYTAGFLSVTLRNPVGPMATPPFYFFGLPDNSFVSVNTQTGKVARA